MLTELPLDLLENIRSFLNVKDNVKLSMTCKTLQLQANRTTQLGTKLDDKYLGVLHTAIVKKKVRRMGKYMKSALLKYSKDDATIKEMIQVYPDLDYVWNNNKNLDTRIPQMKLHDLKELISTANMELWKTILDTEEVKNQWDSQAILLEYCFRLNYKLFQQIADEKVMDINIMRRGIRLHLHDTVMLERILHHFSPSMEELRDWYEYCIEWMHVNSAIRLSQMIV